MHVTKSVMISFAMTVMASAHAQVTIDVAKITCDQFLGYTVADPKAIAIWISGFYHGRTGNTVVRLQDFQESTERLKDACYRPGNGTRQIVQVVEQFLKPEQ